MLSLLWYFCCVQPDTFLWYVERTFTARFLVSHIGAVTFPREIWATAKLAPSRSSFCVGKVEAFFLKGSV